MNQFLNQWTNEDNSLENTENIINLFPWWYNKDPDPFSLAKTTLQSHENLLFNVQSHVIITSCVLENQYFSSEKSGKIFELNTAINIRIGSFSWSTLSRIQTEYLDLTRYYHCFFIMIIFLTRWGLFRTQWNI